MRINRNHNPLNVMVYEKFRLKTLGFSKWLEAKKLGIPSPLELAHFGKPVEDKKRKRTEMLVEVFVKENIVVDGMKRNLAPPPGVEGLSECKASESNIRRIQVKDIIKEVEDYLKTYSSAGMDINWYVEGIQEQAEFKVFSDVYARNSISPKGATKGEIDVSRSSGSGSDIG
ncbi:hypothetical protein Tco_0666687 [Tanacetum coccineum]